MDVSRISAQPDALLQQSGSGREARATEQAATPRAETPPPKAAEPRPAEKSEPPEPPKPVVNTQGQTTGTRINTTA